MFAVSGDNTPEPSRMGGRKAYRGPHRAAVVREQKVTALDVCAGTEKSHMHLWHIGEKYNRLGHRGRKMTHGGWLIKIPRFPGRKYRASGSH